MQNEILNYLWQASACLVGFYVFYKLVLEKLTFFAWNRAYLILTACFSLAIPLVELPILESKSQISETPILQSPNPTQASDLRSDLKKIGTEREKTSDLAKIEQKSDHRSDVKTDKSESFNFFGILLIIYVLGVIFFAFRLFRNLFQIVLLVKRNPKKVEKDYILVNLSPENTVFSFFRYIFIPENSQINQHELNVILRHESVHVRDWHSLDILFAEFLQVAFWFNPVFFFLKRSWRDLHEYLADSQVVKEENAKNYAQLILRFSTQYSAVPLAHAFVDSQLRKRIVMLIRSRSVSPYKWLFGLSLPVIAFFVFLFSLSEKTLMFSESPFIYEIAGKMVVSRQDFYQNKEGKIQIRVTDKDLQKLPIRVVMNVVVSNEVLNYLHFESLDAFNKEGFSVEELQNLGGDRVLFEFRLPKVSFLENLPLKNAERYSFHSFTKTEEKLAYIVPNVGRLEKNKSMTLNLQNNHLQILVQNPIEHTDIEPRLQILLVRENKLIERNSTFPTHFSGKNTFRLLDYSLEKLLEKAQKGDRLIVEFVCVPKEKQKEVSFYWKDEILIEDLNTTEVRLVRDAHDFANPFKPHRLEISLDGKLVSETKELVVDENTKGELKVRMYAGYKTGFLDNDSIRIGLMFVRKGGKEFNSHELRSLHIGEYSENNATQNILKWLKTAKTGDTFVVFAMSKTLGIVDFPTTMRDGEVKIVRKDIKDESEITDWYEQAYPDANYRYPEELKIWLDGKKYDETTWLPISKLRTHSSMRLEVSEDWVKAKDFHFSMVLVRENRPIWKTENADPKVLQKIDFAELRKTAQLGDKIFIFLKKSDDPNEAVLCFQVTGNNGDL